MRTCFEAPLKCPSECTAGAKATCMVFKIDVGSLFPYKRKVNGMLEKVFYSADTFRFLNPWVVFGFLFGNCALLGTR